MDELDLLDWRRRVADLYAAVRAGPPGESTWRRWRDGRDELLRTHPQRPGPPMPWFDHDAALRFTCEVEPIEGDVVGDLVRMRPVGRVRLLGGALTLFWLEGYAGGLFLPFLDATSGDTTYGGGRYLLDTAKGADLGSEGGRLVVDLNYAYHPSCAHDPRWACPLAPPGNRLEVEVRAGERLPSAA